MKLRILVQVGVVNNDDFDFMFLTRDPEAILSIIMNQEYDFKVKKIHRLATNEPHLIEYEAITDNFGGRSGHS